MGRADYSRLQQILADWSRKLSTKKSTKHILELFGQIEAQFNSVPCGIKHEQKNFT